MHLHQLSLLPNVVSPNPWPLIAWQPLGETLVFKVFLLPLSQLRRCATKTVEFKSSSNILSTESSPSEKQTSFAPSRQVAKHVTPPLAVYRRCSGILFFFCLAESRQVIPLSRSLSVRSLFAALSQRRRASPPRLGTRAAQQQVSLVDCDSQRGTLKRGRQRVTSGPHALLCVVSWRRMTKKPHVNVC